jgi:hypothetical protein
MNRNSSGNRNKNVMFRTRSKDSSKKDVPVSILNGNSRLNAAVTAPHIFGGVDNDSDLYVLKNDFIEHL